MNKKKIILIFLEQYMYATTSSSVSHVHQLACYQTSLKLGSRSKLVFVDPPRARCSASRSAGDGANARIASPEKKPGVLLLVATPLGPSLPPPVPLLLTAPDSGLSDVEALRQLNAGVAGMPNNGLAEKLKTLALGLRLRRDSVPSTVERLFRVAER
jgi:hypothetical protein